MHTTNVFKGKEHNGIIESNITHNPANKKTNMAVITKPISLPTSEYEATSPAGQQGSQATLSLLHKNPNYLSFHIQSLFMTDLQYIYIFKCMFLRIMKIKTILSLV